MSIWFVLLSIITFASSVSITPSHGEYYPAITQHVFDHITPNDPVAPNRAGTTLLATFYYPTLQKPNTTRPYLDNTTAAIYESAYAYPPSTLAKLTTSLQFQAPTVPNISYPLTIIFQPGAGGPPAVAYSAILSSLATEGYFVAALDHPYEAPFLQYPYGGLGIYGLPVGTTLNTSLTRAIYDVRLSDIVAFIDLFPGLVAEFGASFNTTHYGIFGHGLGGAVALGALLENETRCKSGCNATIDSAADLDGAFRGIFASENSSADAAPAPLFLMGGLQERYTEYREKTWRTFEKAQTGWWREILIKRAGYLDFSDVTIWKELIPGGGKTPGVGDIDGTNMINLVRRYIGSFFDSTLGKDGSVDWQKGMIGVGTIRPR
ncbi:hypothetical protein MMC10_003006 [Thelotrema lepadinum]|nr:hypothetical protein [Thelotrema lepadinum]